MIYFSNNLEQLPTPITLKILTGWPTGLLLVYLFLCFITLKGFTVEPTQGRTLSKLAKNVYNVLKLSQSSCVVESVRLLRMVDS